MEAYIKSGLFERYLIGDVSKEELKEFEYLLSTSKKAKQYLEQLEYSLEKVSLENAITPPAHIKDTLFKNISETTPAIPLNNTKNRSVYFKIAASIAILLGISTFWLFTQLQTIETQVTKIINEKDTLENTLTLVQNDFRDLEKWVELINAPTTKKYILNGNAKAPNAVVISYVNDVEKKVVVNTLNLPSLSKEHDYQMWADVDGEMINMGVLSKNTEMIAMQYIEDAASLNITIEPAGGNDHATVANLITNIYLAP